MTAGPSGRVAAPGGDRMDRLVARAQRRLATYTLILVAALLLSVGAATAVVATRLMDANVDRALEAAAAAAVRPGEEELEADHLLAGADTFLLLVDGAGRIRANPSGVSVVDLPDVDALAAAERTGRDLRSGTYAGTDIRLLTVPGPAESEDDDGHDTQGTFIQAGFVLTLHEQQEAQLYWTIGIVSLLGLAGAALVTWLVTRRALGPVRAAFATERRFVAAASHELRTPVAIVRASAEILEREGLVARAGQPLVTDIVAETDRLGRLVGDMLALASAEAGAVSVDRRPLELIGWLTAQARRAESMVAAHGLSLRTELPGPGPLVVDADEDRLTQLVLILVDNAVEHSPAGGTIKLSLAARGSIVMLSVDDQGQGVPAAERERIFEPFARLPGERRSASGSGLGLAIARQLAGRHAGDLTVEDAPGGGARFVLRVPLATASAAVASLPRSAA
jgi:two-component system sensor histidine kinase CiaH